MWLLNTHRAELEYFADTRIGPSYAILSHTWSGMEQTFREVQKIRAKCRKSDQNPRELVSSKIRNCCKLAERDGYEWVWIDSCCIDKSSSTELSEAINSMFDWYVLAEVCYVYLEDVYTADPENDVAEFHAARWHTRGWTLQELLAPELVVFLSADWKPIGTKHSLCSLVSDATGIDQKYLTREQDIFRAPVCRRMSWASKRKTTRVEDEAYCLLGLFSINMPTLYGEGRRAFQRLQMEIVKQSQDTTLFAWGGWDDGLKAPMDYSTMLSHPPSTSGPARFLLAPSPADFLATSNKYYTPSLSSSDMFHGPHFLPQSLDEQKIQILDADSEQRTGPFGTIGPPSFKVTSYGMKCRFPVGEVDGITIAVLLVERQDQHIGLFLFPVQDSEALVPTHSLYYTSWGFVRPDGESFSYKLADLGSDLYNLRFRGNPIHASWKTIYIRTGCDGPSDRTDVAWKIFQSPSAYTFSTPFRFSRSMINGMSALGLNLDSGELLCLNSESQPQVWCEFFDPFAGEKIEIRVGTCVVSDRRYLWAYGGQWHNKTLGLWKQHSGHDCAMDHVADWPNRTRVYSDIFEQRQVTLWFTDCPHAPGAVVVNVYLGGRVYEKMLREANVTLPSPPSVFTPAPAAVEVQETSPSPQASPPSTETAALSKLVPDSRDEPEFSLRRWRGSAAANGTLLGRLLLRSRK